MFKYAVSNWIYGDEELEQTYSRLRRLGFDALELVGEPERYRPEMVRKLNGEYGLSVSSVLCWSIWPLAERDLAHPDPRMRQAAVSYVCRNVDLAAAVGAPVVVVIPAPSGRTAPHGAPSADNAGAWQRMAGEEWERAVESVRRVSPYAAGKGVTIAIEPINRFESFLLNSAAQGLRFIDAVGSPAVKLHLDTFHMNIEEPDMVAAILQASSVLVNMHVSDSNRCAVGRGHIDFRSIVAALVKVGYRGALVLEPLPPHPHPFVAIKLERFQATRDEEAAESIRILRELERQAPERG